MTQSQDPEPFEDFEAFVKSIDLMHNVYHCESQEQAVHLFREETLGEDELLGAIIGGMLAHLTIVALLGGTDVCHYLREIKKRDSAQWN